jgi:hypothetical protein
VLNQSSAMRAMAAKYLQSARDAKEPGERSTFLGYAIVYARLAQQLKRRETSRAVARGELERGEASQRDGGLERSHAR